jgi:hypothetical protein
LASVFFSYSHADEGLRDQLEKQLAMLMRQSVIEAWHDRRIGAGEDVDQTIDMHIETDDIILLLVSSDFLASDYCYEREMQRAMARHDAGQAIVLPVILRACDWHGAPFGKLLATPPDGRPVTQWPDRDQAFLEVAKAVRAAVGRVGKPKPAITSPIVPLTHPQGAVSRTAPRSSNLRITKRFTERDRDAFRDEAFEYLAKFFENSVAELSLRNPGIEGVYRRIDANRFTAVVYQDGRAVARCTIFMGGAHFDGIAYTSKETTESNSYNEDLTVQADEQMLYLRSTGFARVFHGHQENEKLSPEGAAELYWAMFIEPLQQR